MSGHTWHRLLMAMQHWRGIQSERSDVFIDHGGFGQSLGVLKIVLLRCHNLQLFHQLVKLGSPEFVRLKLREWKLERQQMSEKLPFETHSGRPPNIRIVFIKKMPNLATHTGCKVKIPDILDSKNKPIVKIVSFKITMKLTSLSKSASLSLGGDPGGDSCSDSIPISWRLYLSSSQSASRPGLVSFLLLKIDASAANDCIRSWLVFNISAATAST